MSERANKAALKRELRKLARDFAEDVIATLERHGVFDEDTTLRPRDEARRSRRSSSSLGKLMARIVADLETRSQPVAIGQVAGALGLTSRKIAYPMSMLVDAGQVVRHGTRRAARYQLAPETPKPKTRRKRKAKS